MPITNVQSTGVGATFVVPHNGGTTNSASAAFLSDNTAENVIFAWVFGSAGGAGTFPSSPMVTDSAGNTYTQLFLHLAGNQGGGWVGLYLATNIKAGANTVSFQITGDAPFLDSTYTQAIIAVEYSGMPSPFFQSHAYVQNYGSSGNSPNSLTFTDTFGTSVTVTMPPTGPGGLGSIDTSGAAVDIWSGGVNYIMAAAQSSSAGLGVPAISPAGYQGFAQEIMLNQLDGTYYHYFWDYGVPGPATIRQPQIFVVT